MLQLSFVNFKPNSYILVEGAPFRPYFFIIKSGKVRCFNEAQISGSTSNILGAGDFVGVISCMSGHSQTENVVALTDVVAIMVQKEQYPELIMTNTPIALKIIRAFAQQMRSLNDNLTKITLKKNLSDSPEGIFTVASYYDEQGDLDVAIYAYYQYLKTGPSGENAEKAKRRFLALKPKSRAVYFEPNADHIRKYPRDTMIFSECQAGADMFIIQDGSVRITKVVQGSEVTLAVLKKGDMFGEMALLENKTRSASAIAAEPCALMVVNHANFNQMVSTQPVMISRLTNMLADRLWSMYRQLANTRLKEPREKLIDMISIQIEKKKSNFIKGVAYPTDLSPLELINLCGIPDEDRTKAMHAVETDQNIKIINGKITIPDVPELIKQAAFYRKQNNKRANETI